MLHECACPEILGSPRDARRFELISCREIGYALEHKGGIESSLLPVFSADRGVVTSNDRAQTLEVYLRAEKAGNKEQAEAALILLIALSCRSDSSLMGISCHIPHDGGREECLFMREVLKICPGE